MLIRNIQNYWKLEASQKSSYSKITLSRTPSHTRVKSLYTTSEALLTAMSTVKSGNSRASISTIIIDQDLRQPFWATRHNSQRFINTLWSDLRNQHSIDSSISPKPDPSTKAQPKNGKEMKQMHSNLIQRILHSSRKHLQTTLHANWLKKTTNLRIWSI